MKTSSKVQPRTEPASELADIAEMSAESEKTEQDVTNESQGEEDAPTVAPAEVVPYSFKASQQFFAKHSYRDVARKKVHFSLSFCAVFTVVLCTLLVNTLVDIGPIIFLKLAEGQYGQYDAIIF